MYKGLSMALLVIGAFLLVYGVHASESISNDISRFFNGSPTEKTIWLLVGGTAAGLAGLFGIFHSFRAQGM